MNGSNHGSASLMIGTVTSIIVRQNVVVGFSVRQHRNKGIARVRKAGGKF